MARNVSRPDQSNRWLLASDVDDTLLGDPSALSELNIQLARQKERVTIALNSSRPCRSLRASLQDHPELPPPDFLIGALGTEIQDVDGNEIESYARHLDVGWDRDTVVSVVPHRGTRSHPQEYQTVYKVSYDIERPDIARFVRSKLMANGVDARVTVTHGSKLDIIPASAGKGAAVDYLRDLLGIDRDRVVVAGDSANDLDMFSDEYFGIVVANADSELMDLRGPRVFHASGRYAAGVMEGLRHWNFI